MFQQLTRGLADRVFDARAPRRAIGDVARVRATTTACNRAAVQLRGNVPFVGSRQPIITRIMPYYLSIRRDNRLYDDDDLGEPRIGLTMTNSSGTLWKWCKVQYTSSVPRVIIEYARGGNGVSLIGLSRDTIEVIASDNVM